MQIISQEESIRKITIWLKPRFLKLEKLIGGVTLLLFCLKLLNVNQIEFLFAGSITILALLYLFNAFALEESTKENGLLRFMHYTVYWSLSVLLIGILYIIMAFPGANIMLTVSVFSMVLIFAMALFYKGTKDVNIRLDRHLIQRITIYLIIGLFFILMPKEDLKKMNIAGVQNTEITNESINH